MIIKPNGTISRVPSGYTEVEYLQSSGTQYINTGVIANSSINIDIDTYFVSGAISRIFGAQKSNYYYVCTISSDTRLRFYYYFSFTSVYNYSMGNNKITIMNGNQKINGISYKNDTDTFTTNLNLYLFASNEEGVAKSFGENIRIKECKLYENNILVRDFIPCIRNSDNTAGLYDIVNNVFYTNSGTGVFTTGDIIKDYEVLKPRKGSTNIKNVYLGENLVYGG